MAALAISASGCVSELLKDTDVTVRNISCAAVNPARFAQVHLEVQVEAGADLNLDDAIGALIANLGLIGRPADSISWSTVAYQEPADMELWLDELPRFDRSSLLLYVQVFSSLDSGDTMALVAPGVFALSAEAIKAGATDANISLETATRAVFLHAAGHTLGLVNRGIPFNSTVIAGRETTGNHEPAAISVMFSGWHSVASMPKSNSTYDRFSDALLDDWRAAKMGVCA